MVWKWNAGEESHGRLGIVGYHDFRQRAADSALETDDNSLSGTFLAPEDVPSYADNGGKLYVDRNPRHGNPYFNPSYFMQEPLGQIGNAMRRFFVGPGLNNSNLALLKNTKISETKEVQFRVEAFNVFNHAQFNNPSGDFDNTGHGRIWLRDVRARSPHHAGGFEVPVLALP